MSNQSIRDQILSARGSKDAFIMAKNYLTYLPMNQLIEKLQEAIDEAEDTEIRLAVELQKTSNPPGDIL
jgi:hypothetical protein